MKFDIHSYIQGGTRAKLNQSELRTIELALPPLSEQHCIVTILDSIDSQIHLTEQLIAKLKLQREGLLHDLLTRGLDEHGQLRDPVAHPELFKDSVLGRIPNEWEIISLGTICIRAGGSIQTGPFGSQLHFKDY